MHGRRNRLLVVLILVAFLVVAFMTFPEVASGRGLEEDDFTRISVGGFGDPMNNYAWSMAYFKDDLYVGTGRNIPYSLGLALKEAGIIPEDTELPYLTHPRGTPGDPEWAEDMSGEIWRYHSGQWTRVHKAPTLPTPYGTYPEGIGYRIMATFNGAIYAGVGEGFGPILLMMSTDGENWLPVNTASIPSPGDTRALAVHNGKLYVGTSGQILGDGVGGIYASSDPQPLPGPNTWEKIVDFGENNTAVLSLNSFNGYLYAATGNINGFEVWRSNAQAPEDPGKSIDDWTRVVSGGAGDAWNVWGGTTGTFNGHLYVGSMSLPIEPIGPKGFDLIRIYTNDAWDLIVGSYYPRAPTESRGPPLSGWPAGFGNPLNFYCWSLQVYNGYLYLGSFDASVFLGYLTQDQINSLIDQETLDWLAQELLSSGIDEQYVQELLTILEEGDPAVLIQKLVQYLGGADLWKSPDGIHWAPVSLNGFDNPTNYGFRTMVAGSLFVGTANPFEGCEVWRAEPPPVGGIWTQTNKFELLAPYLGLVSVIASGAAVSGVIVKRMKKKQA